MTDDLTEMSKDALYNRLGELQAEWDRTYRRRDADALQVAWAVDNNPDAVEFWMVAFREKDAAHRRAADALDAISAEIDRRAAQ